ncbi:MAG: hypothetical protein QOH58_2135 [Thermoleophilaceae bacterium]|nr:hypothetical protein [Thermoleophilaceae bacterium]
MIDVELHTQDVPDDQAEAARERIASLDGQAARPITGARLTLRRAMPRGGRPYVADATLLYDGRLLAAHTTGRSPLEAGDLAAERLRRQLRRIRDAEVAQRNEPRVLQAAVAELDTGTRYLPEATLKPPRERQIIPRRPFVDVPLPTLDAIDLLLDLDVEFSLFTHERTNEDVVVHRLPDGRIGLLHPPGSVLADESDLLVTEPSRYSEPLTLETARAEEDVLNHRFLYFTATEDGRGKVLYLRYDGDYGLVEPA